MESLNQTMPVKKDDLSLLEIKEEKKVSAADSQSKGLEITQNEQNNFSSSFQQTTA